MQKKRVEMRHKNIAQENLTLYKNRNTLSCLSIIERY